MTEITPSDEYCRLVCDVEGIVKEDSATKSKINGYSTYDFFRVASGCRTIEECEIKARLMGIELEEPFTRLVKEFINETDCVKEYKLVVMRIKCGQFTSEN